MRFTQSEYLAYEAKRMAQAKPLGSPDTREIGAGGLHEKIISYCNSQHPRWKFIHCRTDKKATIEVGSHDFTVFLPGGNILCVECKAKDGKLSIEQRGWILELKMLGHEVHVVYSLEEFINLTNQNQKHDNNNTRT